MLAATRQANIHTARDRLRVAVPATVPLFDRLAARGEALRPHTVHLLALLDDYGPQELAAAIATALTRDALGAGSIAHLLETAGACRAADRPWLEEDRRAGERGSTRCRQQQTALESLQDRLHQVDALSKTAEKLAAQQVIFERFAIDEIGYLAYDAHAADLLFQIVSRRYEYRPVRMTTNLAFKHWDTIFPNASCAVALIDRLPPRRDCRD